MPKSVKNRSGRVTLVEVANRAGVSVSTASLVLADKARERRISDEVHARVRQAAQELDYSPNLLVQSIHHGRTHVLSFFNCFRNRSTNDLYMYRFSTVLERTAGLYGYDILVHCDFRRSVEETYRFLNGGRADGLLVFAPPPQEPLLAFLRASRLPTVLLNGHDREATLPQVNDDLESGMRQVADALLVCGHRRIAAITDIPGGNPEAPLRIAALKTYLESHGVALPEHWIVPARTRGELEVALKRLLAEAAPPTAFFCWRDHAGYQLLDLCESLGISVPEQLSLVGYDGIRWPTNTRHELASVQVDIEALAETAVILLDARVNGKPVGIVHTVPAQFSAGTTLATL